MPKRTCKLGEVEYEWKVPLRIYRDHQEIVNALADTKSPAYKWAAAAACLVQLMVRRADLPQVEVGGDWSATGLDIASALLDEGMHFKEVADVAGLGMLAAQSFFDVIQPAGDNPVEPVTEEDLEEARPFSEPTEAGSSSA